MSEPNPIHSDDGEGTSSASWNPAFRPEDAASVAPGYDNATVAESEVPVNHSEARSLHEDAPLPVEDHMEEADSTIEGRVSQSGDAVDETSHQQPSEAWNNTEGSDDFFDNLAVGQQTHHALQDYSSHTEIKSPSKDDELLTAQPTSPPQDNAVAQTKDERIPARASGNSGQNGVDPALSLSRADSDAFHLLDHVDRSSSFPPFFSQPVQPLPPTQAETMMEQAHAEETEDTYEHGDPLRSSHHDSLVPGADVTWLQKEEGSANDDVSFFDKINQQSVPLPNPSNSDVRFEEGVPLVSQQQVEEKENGITGAGPSAMDELFDSESEAGDISFFNQPHDTDTPAPHTSPTLERKDTTDVLSAMHFEPHGSHKSGDGVSVPEHVPEKTEDRPAARDTSAPQEDVDAMWKAALADDEFLPEDDDGFLSDASDGSQSSFLDQLRDTSNPERLQSNGTTEWDAPVKRGAISYAPHQPSTTELSQPLNGALWAGASLGSHIQRPDTLAKTESFVAQSKGGYKSPYDLPDELTARPRKRIPVHPSNQNLRPAMAPPRSSSMASDQGLPPPARQFPQLSLAGPTSVDLPRPDTGSSVDSPPISISNGVQSTPKASASNASFFEELPVSSRPRPSTSLSSGRYTPLQPPVGHMQPPIARTVSSTVNHFHPPPSVQQPANIMPPPSTQAPAHTPNPHEQFGLQSPERLDPYASFGQHPPPPSIPTSRYSPAPPVSQSQQRASSTSRYSPAPPSHSSGRPPANRYASQPPQVGPPPSTVLPFQPRTSSPLAHHGKPSVNPPPMAPTVGNSNIPLMSPPSRGAPSSSYGQQIDAQRKWTPLNTQAAPSAVASKPNLPTQAARTHSDYLPQQAVGPDSVPAPDSVALERRFSNTQTQPFATPHNAHFAPPRRSQTQSPGQMDTSPAFAAPVQPPMPRPASVSSFNPHADLTRPRALSQTQNFIAPDDGTQMDELQRWRGCPIFHFNPTGSIVSSFPRHTPRYSPGHILPMIKPTPGETQVRNAKDVLNVDTQAARFPGPLRAKSKKKAILGWLSDRISLFERINVDQSLRLPDVRNCHDEKILLWKIVRVIVEYDGVIEGKAEAQKTIAGLLAPELSASEPDSVSLGVPQSDPISRPSGTQVQRDSVDPEVIEQIRKYLLQGEREKAVWHAVDHRLWAHAMLISSTLEKTVWQQLVQEFVRQEVRSVGENIESLAALYQCFGGNFEDSIDQLVPPSARAGLQMVSKVSSAGPTRNALDGLDKWRETLCLAINNRCGDDHLAISALGRLLATYSRVEASHICFLLSRALPSVIFGGTDEPQASIVLLGVDQRQPAFYNDEDAILLTEVYEFATSVLVANASTSAFLPHFQAYKLQRAIMLGETGYKNEALQYCDAIGGSVKANTKMSPYFHPIFLAELEELATRLRQAPAETSSGWKPNMEKVSTGILSRFNTFVTGGDDETASNESSKDAQEFGPFAKIAGTPNISREPSSVDLYSSYASGSSQPIPIVGGNTGRYAPNNHYAPRSFSEQVRGRSSLEVARSPSYATLPQSSPSAEQVTFGVQHPPATPSLASPFQSLMQSPQHQQSPPGGSYVASALRDNSPYAPQPLNTPSPPGTGSSYQPYQPKPRQESYDGPPHHEAVSMRAEASMDTVNPMFGGYQPNMEHSLSVPPRSASPPSGEASYQPVESASQSYGGYEPPSDEFVPYEPEPDSDEDKQRKSGPAKKKSFMDLDEDEPTSAAPVDIHQKPVNKDLDRARKDAEAEAAFRRAAEEDAKRADQQKTLNKKASWFGGWFAGKGELDNSKSEGGKPIYKAKLGEENHFYYDKDLKKWVNKKDPNSATASAAPTPPPPRAGPPSRTPSGMGPPPAGGLPKAGGLPSSTSLPSIPNPPSRSESPAVNGSTIPPSSSLAPPPPLLRASTGGPPKPAVKKISDIDDLLGGPPMPRTGGTMGRGARKKRTGYVDIMAQK